MNANECSSCDLRPRILEAESLRHLRDLSTYDAWHPNLAQSRLTFNNMPAACMQQPELTSSFSKLRDALVGHNGGWALFVGDSDTRYFVLTLLQAIAATAYSPAAAARNSGPWLGVGVDGFGPPEEKTDWMRRCLLDFVFNASGQQVSSRSMHCRAGKNRREYAICGQDYNLSMTPAPNAGLRVTFVATSVPPQVLTTLKGLTAQLVAADFSARPSVLYAAVGAWYMTIDDVSKYLKLAGLLHTALNGVASEIAPPQVLVYGTTLGMENRIRNNQSFDHKYILPLLQESQLDSRSSSAASVRHRRRMQSRLPWRVFERTFGNPLTWNVTNDGRHGLVAVEGHAPPVVNLVDLHRMFASGLFRPSPLLHSDGTRPADGDPLSSIPTPQPLTPIQASKLLKLGTKAREAAVAPASSLKGRNAVCKRLQLHFSPWCAGYGGLELPTESNRIRRLEPASSQKGNFGEAYFHFCNASFHVL